MDPNTPDFSLGTTSYNPKQGTFEFFWPLTEQIPLELDFTSCPPHQYYIKAQGQPLDGPFNTGMVYAAGPPVTTLTTHLELNREGLVFHGFDMPWYRKLIFKLIGFKWR